MPIELQNLLPDTVTKSAACMTTAVAVQQPSPRVTAVINAVSAIPAVAAMSGLVPARPAVVERQEDATDWNVRIAKQKTAFVVAVQRLCEGGAISEGSAVDLEWEQNRDRYPDLKGMSYTGTYSRAKAELTDIRGKLHTEWWEQLLPQTHRCGRRRQPLPVAFLEKFNLLYLSHNHLTVRTAWENACLTLHLPQNDWPELGKVEAYVRSIPKAVKVKTRESQADYENYAGGYAIIRWNCVPGEVWISDHRRLDFWVKVPLPDGSWAAVRPWCTVFRDAASGYLVSCVIYTDTAPNHGKILEALWRGILATGGVPPRIIITDNGKDYKKRGALQDVEIATAADAAVEALAGGYDGLAQEGSMRMSVARALGIQVILADPYKGRQKPVERTFRDFADQFDPLVIGYTGRSVAKKIGYDQKTFAGNIGKLLNEQQIIDFFGWWLNTVYHTRACEFSRITDGRTPAELWAERKPLRPALTREELDYAMLLPHSRLLDVRRGAVGSDVFFGGWPYSGRTAEDVYKLRIMHGDQVLVKTSWSAPMVDLGHKRIPLRIWLFHPDGRFVCEAEASGEVDRFGGSAETLAVMRTRRVKVDAVKRFDREVTKALRSGNRRELAPSSVLGISEGGMFDQAKNVAGSVVEGPGRGKVKAARDEAAELAAGDNSPTEIRAEVDQETASRFAEFMRNRGTQERPQEPASQTTLGMAEYLKNKEQDT